MASELRITPRKARGWPPPEIARLRLLDAVTRAEARLLRIVAPAGYGKTTFIHQLGRQFDSYAICDCEGAASVVELCRRVLAAVAGTSSEAMGGLSTQIISLQDDPAQWIDLARRVWAPSIGRRELFVFDNLESLAEAVACREFITQLIALSPADRTMALCSRVHDGVALPRQIAPHLSMRLDAQDLAFDRDEFRQVFEGTGAQAIAIERIEQIANGWPIAILLLRRLLLTGAGTPAKLLENQVAFADLYDYLSEHVFSTLAEEQVTALLTCVAVPEATAGDVELALGRDAEQVRAILDTVPFVARSGGRLTVHPLIAKTLHERYGARCAALLRSVADGHLAAERLLRSAQLYLAGGDKESAAATLDRGNWLAAATWPLEFAQIVSQIDDETVLRYPAVWTATSIVRASQQTPEEWLAKTQTVWANVQSDERPYVRATAFFSYIAALMNLGRLDEAASIIREPPACLDQDDFSVAMCCTLCTAAIDAWTGRFERLKECRAKLEPVIAVSAGWHAQYLYEIGARVYRTNGDWPAERRALEHAMDFGRTSNMATIPLWVLTYQVCGSWLAGDNVYCQAKLAELESEMYAGIAKAFSFIVDCARGRAAEAASGYERPELRAWGYLIAAARAEAIDDRRRFARLALQAADGSGQIFVRVLARIATAELDAECRERFYAEAAALASNIDSDNLRSAVLTAWHGHGQLGMLTTFVGQFRESEVGALKIELLAARIVRRGVAVRLTRREFELIAFMALRRRPVMAPEVLEAIWPDQDESSNVLRVCATRLRGRVGSDILERSREGYCIGQPVTADLFEIDSLCRRFASEQGRRTLALLNEAFEALCRGVPSWLSGREWFQPYLVRIEELRRNVGLAIARDALARSELETAAAIAEILLSFEPCDEAAREVAIRARLARGDKSGALREYRLYHDALSSEFGVEAPQWLRSLAVHGGADAAS